MVVATYRVSNGAYFDSHVAIIFFLPGVGLLALWHLMFAAMCSHLDTGRFFYETMATAFREEVRLLADGPTVTIGDLGTCEVLCSSA